MISMQPQRVVIEDHKRADAQTFLVRAHRVHYLVGHRASTMITDARRQDDLIAALELQPLFKSGIVRRVAPRDQGLPHRQSMLQYPNGRSALVASLPFAYYQRPTTGTMGGQAIAAIAAHRTAASRAAANIATWRTFLPEDCVVAMINEGWDKST
jgi:hypothetical protein